MIKVTRATVASGEVELIVTAARFFIDRLIPAAQQKRLSLKIELTDKPGRTPIAIKWLVGSSGLFGMKPPQNFEMTVSAAAGVKDGLEIAANEIVHVAQVVNGRLKICLKNRKINGQTEQAYAASWIGSRFAFVDMTPRPNRLWEAEAATLKTQLVDEFLSWSAGRLAKLPTKKPKRNNFGLYPIRPKNIAAPISIPASDAASNAASNAASDATLSTAAVPAAHQPDQVVDLTIDDLAQLPASNRTAAVDTARTAAIDTQFDNSTQDEPSLPGAAAMDALENEQVISGISGQPAAQDPAFARTATDALTPQSQSEKPQPVKPQPLVNYLKIDSGEFKIAVEVPRLGMDRILHSAMLHGKLNDLLERGLISYDAARAAFRQAQQNQIGR
ncbi:hypothetical protein OAT72_01085 [Alphaproteobacteria bacterium]|nr:hypothetical protein [Alphaproteobacteria bacterium]